MAKLVLAPHADQPAAHVVTPRAVGASNAAASNTTIANTKTVSGSITSKTAATSAGTATSPLAAQAFCTRLRYDPKAPAPA